MQEFSDSSHELIKKYINHCAKMMEGKDIETRALMAEAFADAVQILARFETCRSMNSLHRSMCFAGMNSISLFQNALKRVLKQLSLPLTNSSMVCTNGATQWLQS